MLSDSDDEDVTQLTINEHYAKAFEFRKEREELEKLKAKYGSDAESSDEDVSTDSESAESEDEDGEELTPVVDAAILRTLARIRKKDPTIYQSEKNIFGEEQEKLAGAAPPAPGQKKLKDKSKPITLRQVAIDAMLNPSRSSSPELLPHVEEQRALRDETIAAFHTAAGDEDEDEGLLIPREKTKDEQEEEEEEYRKFLEREVGDLRELVSIDGDAEEEVIKEEGRNKVESDEKKSKKKKRKKDEEKQSRTEKDQEFLMNYILNRGWIDRSANHVPTYNEITSKRKGKGKATDSDSDEPSKPHIIDNERISDDEGLLSDASFESLASHFESSYNHRFEEPGAATIPSFPRSLPSLVRRQDTTRKDARERRKERKEEEIQKRKEEVRRMKALKMREVRRRLEKIAGEGGLKDQGGAEVDEALRELDLEGEWDPEKHDKQMMDLFGGDGDFVDDGSGDEEDGLGDGVGDGKEPWGEEGMELDADGKPVWNDDIDIGDIPVSDDDTFPITNTSKKDKKKEKKKKKKKSEAEIDEGVDVDAMDADLKGKGLDDEEWDGTEEMRKRKLDEYMDEIYGLDFNDMIGDLPTRFKYTAVTPQNYSLTPVEILLATDQELNEYMSVKKYAPYRQEKNGRWDSTRNEKLRELKTRIAQRSGKEFVSSVGGNRSAAVGAEGGEKQKKRMGKKERMRLKAAAAEGRDEDESRVEDMDKAPGAAVSLENGGGENRKKKGKKRKREAEVEMDMDADAQSDVLGKGEHNTEASEVVEGERGKKKKRRRHKKKDDDAT
ncbi:KRI1-like family C-terminal-domain-containing protein [Crucibulum laeve]|uniref:KRI1-like family C-terminal-domain-containing protein n=1 Tax=Crucibulum laeve TaxID=68775 RepID=A0A5C3MI66_9AGAR|nr:KRI1-like family C-terminal-domain-containing protein [Crucibulum laeve]